MKKNKVLASFFLFLLVNFSQAQCIITATANATGCNQFTNTYSVSGTVSFVNPPSSGSLTIINSCGGSQVFNAPFTSPITYTFGALVSNGATCNVVSSFSSNSSCYASVMYVAPESCDSSVCSITGVAVPTACDSLSNTYNVSGSFSFIDPPTTGALIITNSCGGNMLLPLPVVSPVSYSFPGMLANGDTCIVNARFSAISTCFYNATYIAPLACGTASVGEAELLFQFNIAPNPSNGIFNISFESTAPQMNLVISDVLGRVVYHEAVSNSKGLVKKQIDSSEFRKGLYFVQLRTNGGNITKKIIIE